MYPPQKKDSGLRYKAKYKLVVYFKDGQGANPLNKPKVFFSREYYDRKGEQGLTVLKNLVTGKFKGTYITALVYNNQTGTPLFKWIGREMEGEQTL
jgi:hypothetical protein